MPRIPFEMIAEVTLPTTSTRSVEAICLHGWAGSNRPPMVRPRVRGTNGVFKKFRSRDGVGAPTRGVGIVSSGEPREIRLYFHLSSNNRRANMAEPPAPRNPIDAVNELPPPSIMNLAYCFQFERI